MRRWFLFEHPTKAPERDGKKQRGIIAAHFVNPDGKLECGEREVTLIEDAQWSRGFGLACVACLQLSEGAP